MKHIKKPLSIAIITIQGVGFCLLSSCVPPVEPEVNYPVPPPLDIPTPNVPDVPDTKDIETPPLVNPDPIRPTIPTAKRVPGRPTHVFNPFTQNMVDVDGIPSGTKVLDPQDPDPTHKFYVP